MPGIQPIRSNLRLEVLGPAELAELKSATLHVLEHVGVRFPSERALRIFADHGARVNPDSQVVKLRQSWCWRQCTTRRARTPWADARDGPICTSMG